ncbi:MORC family CW-type zinc finger protein 3 isoform X2 [Xenopus laevis]|uniref:MORC family CW-type zinc finger protein 3 isoform X2 n=1 Tax=Xenopus laevis TaxID=8355 RepID=A0A8J0UDG8_XENLA|nr:MORC family CW-type zinc finger protein 3 isoform X2 [Xenopus laevis]
MAADKGIRLSALNPKFLHTNSTSHTWPFSAFAELIDNAYDPDVNAKHIWIDQTAIKNNICLTFADDGNGMTLDKLYKMLSFGFSDKHEVKGHHPIGLYGNGFKSGSMWLGKDAIVFTKNKSGMHVGMLSQSYLEKINAQHVLVPIISFNEQRQLVQTPDSEANLQAITTYSLLNSEPELLAELDAITGPKGTRIIIWNLRRDTSGETEFDFETDEYDIRIPAETDGMNENYRMQERVNQTAPDCDFSLRAYCKILYLKPRMQIILRGQKVQTQLVAKNLAYTEKDVYKPKCLPSLIIKITFGYNCRNKEHYGIMMYHKNRLIKAYKRVGCQLQANNMGVGVVGVVECNFLKPIHNKQDFDDTKVYRLTLAALGTKLNDYWIEMKAKKRSDPLSRPVEDIQKTPDQKWVQCDDCLKWRKLPDGVAVSKKDTWSCKFNTDPRFRDCSVPEEPEDDDITQCTYEKTQKGRNCSVTEEPGAPDDDDIPHSSNGKTSKRRNSKQLQQVTPNKRRPPSERYFCLNDFQLFQETGMSKSSEQLQQVTPAVPNTPPNWEMQPSLSSNERPFVPNQCQETDINQSYIPPLSNENTPTKQKPIGSETSALLQGSGDDDDDVIIIEDKGTSSSSVAPENKNYELHVKREENGGYDCNGIAQREMGTPQEAHDQESSKHTTDQEKESLKKYCGELFVKVKGLEEKVSDLENKYEQACKEINRLKECKVLQNLKEEPGTETQKPAEKNSNVDDMSLQLNGSSTEHD